MRKEAIVKVVSIAASVLSVGAGLAGDWCTSQNMNSKIEKEVAKKVAEIASKTASEVTEA